MCKRSKKKKIKKKHITNGEWVTEQFKNGIKCIDITNAIYKIRKED